MAGGRSGPDPGVTGAALVTLAFVQILRVWMPSILFVVGDAGETSALLMGAFALGTLAIGPAAVLLLRPSTRQAWWVAGAGLAVSRFALLLTDGGVPQAIVATAGIVAGTAALTAMATGPAGGRLARTGILFGLAAEVSIHAVLGAVDIVWFEGPAAAVATTAIVVALLLAVREHARELTRPYEGAPAGPAWAWLLPAPLLLLTGMLAGVPGRVAVATDWSDGVVAGTVVAGQALAVLTALAAPRIGVMQAGAAGAGLVLIGTAGALEPSGVGSVLAQLALAAGLGAVVGAFPAGASSSSPVRRGLAAAGSLVLFVVTATAYYGAYDFHLGINNRLMLLGAAVMVAVIAVATISTQRSATTRPVAADLATAATVTTVLLALVLASGLARSAPELVDPAPGAPGAPVRLVLANAQMGFDPAGRFAAHRLADVIAQHDPDVVVLNEVDRGWLVTGGHDLLRLLSAELGLPYAFAPAADEVWGNAILSRFPLQEFEHVSLPRGIDPMRRSKFVAVIEVAPDQQLGLIGTHLSHVGTGGEARIPQARAVAGAAARLHERELPVVLAGDLNAEPGSSELATFEGLLEPAMPPGNPTWPSWAPEHQIDHVLVSPSIEVLEAWPIDTQVSDHLPVAVTLRIGTGEP